MAAATKAKTQVLLNESQGTQVRENVHKATGGQNVWRVVLADHPSQAEEVVNATQHSAVEILQHVRAHMYNHKTLDFAHMIFGLTSKND